MNNKYINPSLMNFRLFHRSPHLTGFCIIKLVSFSQFKISPFPSLKKPTWLLSIASAHAYGIKKGPVLLANAIYKIIFVFHKVPFNCIWNLCNFFKKIQHTGTVHVYYK